MWFSRAKVIKVTQNDYEFPKKKKCAVFSAQMFVIRKNISNFATSKKFQHPTVGKLATPTGVQDASAKNMFYL